MEETSVPRHRCRSEEASHEQVPHDRGGHDQGIVRDERGQEQPRDNERAQQVSRVDRGGDPPGEKQRG
jgi:hypothetical protein